MDANYYDFAGLKIAVRNRKILFLVFDQTKCYGYSKEQSQRFFLFIGDFLET